MVIGNRYAQISATVFGWLHLFPVNVECEAPEALSLLFQWEGAPAATICDSAKEMNLGKFNKELLEALFIINLTVCPKWDFCMQFHGKFHSCDQLSQANSAGDASFDRPCIQPHDNKTHKMNNHNLW